MNRQSGSQLPIPVTPKTPVPMAPALPALHDGSFPKPPRQQRRSRDRLSGLFAAAKTRTSPIWRPSTAQTPPTPQWPLPKVPFTIRDENPALTKTYTQPREAPLPPPPPPPHSSCSDRSASGGSVTTLANAPEKSSATATTEAAAPLLHPRSPRSPASPPRPPYFPQPAHGRGASFQTRYMNMALSIDKIPRSHNILANLFAWMVLVAFVMAPGNFVSPVSYSHASASAEKNEFVSAPLLGICLALFGLGVIGHTWLRWLHRRNYIWLMNRIYLPLMLNSLAGFITTLVLVDVQHGWWWSTAAYVTVSLEGATLLFSAGMFFLLDFVLLRKLKEEHYRQTNRKNVVDLVKAGQRPPFAPGSVV